MRAKLFGMVPGVPVAQSPVGAWTDRLIAAVVFAAGALMVVLLGMVVPDARGHGTHERLGMDPCGWPSAYGLPCPTCGVTTAACHLVHGSLWQSLVTQPFGAVLAGAGIVAALYAGFCLAAGRSFMDRLVRLPYGTMLVWSIVLFLGAWAYKYVTFTP